MRFFMVSMTIIFFCLAMTIANEVDTLYFDGDGTTTNVAQNRSLFGWTSTPFINSSDLTYVSSSGNLQSAVGEIGDVKSTPTSFIGDAADTGWTMLVTGYNILRFILVTLFNSTLNVGPFLNTLGNRTGVKFFSDGIALVITIGINMIYLMGIAQLYKGVSFKDGA